MQTFFFFVSAAYLKPKISSRFLLKCLKGNCVNRTWPSFREGHTLKFSLTTNQRRLIINVKPFTRTWSILPGI